MFNNDLTVYLCACLCVGSVHVDGGVCTQHVCKGHRATLVPGLRCPTPFCLSQGLSLVWNILAM